MVRTRQRDYEISKAISEETHSITLQKLTPTSIGSQRPISVLAPPGFPFVLEDAVFGLIQERIHKNLYALVVQAILWNQTRGLQARPVLFRLLTMFPTPLALSRASMDVLVVVLQPIGLQRVRSARLIALAKVWVEAPPSKERRYRKLHYPDQGCDKDIAPGEVLSLHDDRQGWEIAHLPGIGRYALDSFRIFHRDHLRGMNGKGDFEAEWKRVLPQDKDLKAYLVWKWEQEGYKWDMLTGKVTKV